MVPSLGWGYKIGMSVWDNHQNAKQCLEHSDVAHGFLCIRNDCWIVIELSIMIYETLSGDIS